MTNLLLSPTRKYFWIGDENDYVVLDGGRVIGRIMLHPHASDGRSWFTTSLDKRGYSATREEAMADFKAVDGVKQTAPTGLHFTRPRKKVIHKPTSI